jgi:hypothetical protein
MDLQQFTNSFTDKLPPNNFSDPLKALWYDGKGDWEKAHQFAQMDEGNFEYDRIHAYLHRKEGDIFNARYWYRRIDLPFPTNTLEEEWESLVVEYLLKSIKN